MTLLPTAGAPWREYTIDQLKADADGALVIGPFGSRMKADCYVPFGVPVIRGNNLSNTRALCGDFVYITDEMADSMRSCNAYADDLVFPHRGAIGEVGIVPRDGKRYMISTSLMKLKCNRDLVNPLFLFYFFRSALGRHELLKNASTVGTPGIGQPLTSLRSIRVRLPSRKEQDAIAEILGALDDKIELNRRMNETLEGMAQAIFKSWFVDFDPVRAKAAGRQPSGMDADTAALFPDRFQDSPLGKIPKGWSAGSLLDHARLLSGGTPKTDEPSYWGGTIPWASAKDVSQCGETFLISTERSITEHGLENSATQMIDTYSTAIVARGATTGRMAMFGFPIAMNQTCYALRSKPGSHFFLYCQARRVIGDLVHSAHGSVFDTITTRTFETTSVLMPDSRTAAAFDRAVQPIFTKTLARQKESASLTALRDALLPKLLSGEVTPRQLERGLR